MGGPGSASYRSLGFSLAEVPALVGCSVWVDASITRDLLLFLQSGSGRYDSRGLDHRDIVGVRIKDAVCPRQHCSEGASSTAAHILSMAFA